MIFTFISFLSRNIVDCMGLGWVVSGAWVSGLEVQLRVCVGEEERSGYIETAYCSRCVTPAKGSSFYGTKPLCISHWYMMISLSVESTLSRVQD